MIAREAGASDPDAEVPESRGSVADLEIALLLDGVHRLSGYDFREYAPTLLRRRVAERMRVENARTITGLLERVVHEAAALDALVLALTTPPILPFRDPATFATLAREVVPRLRTYPYFRLWIAGHAADAFSLAIMLDEANLLSRARIYATEATEAGLTEARSGALRADALAGLASRFAQAGGRGEIERYLEREPGGVRFSPRLAESVLFARHDLAAEGSFNEFEAVVVRTPLATYGRSLAYRVHRTLYESTARLGFLCVPAPDGLAASPHRGAFEPLPTCDGVFRRVR